MNNNDKIFVAGHKGLVGSSIVKKLKELSYNNILTMNKNELNLIDQNATDHFFDLMRPDYVFLAAARVGGIYANSTYPADFTYENLMVECNIIKSCHKYEVKKLLFLGSSCIYPRDCEQPIKEEYLLSGPLEKTNDGYAIAKIAGIIMCQKYNKQYGTNFISIMPTNLYGSINDNYDPKTSHVLPGMIRKFHYAKKNNLPIMELWGTGKPLREFLHVSDLADASIFLMNNYDSSDIINVGSGEEISIRRLAWTIQDIVGYEGKVYFNDSYPDGTPRKFLDTTKLRNLGWEPKISLEEGIRSTYDEILLKKKFD
jgi:GDP-L-fucose synthase